MLNHRLYENLVLKMCLTEVQYLQLYMYDDNIDMYTFEKGIQLDILHTPHILYTFVVIM